SSWFYCVHDFSVVVVFFFSSRRRHTRCYRDWSSDVCSSDLSWAGAAALWWGRDTFYVQHERGWNHRPVWLFAGAVGICTAGIGRSEERRVGKECRLRGGRDR